MPSDERELPNTRIFTLATDGYAPFVLNLHASMERLGIGGDLVVYSLGDEIHRELSAAGLPSIRYGAIGAAEEWSDYGTRSFAQTMSFKYVISLDIMAIGMNVLYVDSDIVFLRNPFGYLGRAIAAEGADLVIQDEQPVNLYNAGFWWARAVPQTRDLFVYLRSALDTPDFTCDQKVLNARLRGGSSIKVLALDPELFACGNQFLDGTPVEKGGVHINRSHRPFPMTDAYLLHFNFLIGKAQKAAAMMKHGAVFHPSLRAIYNETRSPLAVRLVRRLWGH